MYNREVENHIQRQLHHGGNHCAAPLSSRKTPIREDLNQHLRPPPALSNQCTREQPCYPCPHILSEAATSWPRSYPTSRHEVGERLHIRTNQQPAITNVTSASRPRRSSTSIIVLARASCHSSLDGAQTQDGIAQWRTEAKRSAAQRYELTFIKPRDHWAETTVCCERA